MSSLAQFGMIGLAVMGRNLALNIEEHGYSVAVWNLETAAMESFVREHEGKRFVGTKTLEELVKAIERPRRIMMMIKAGSPVDITLEKLAPLLAEGDIVIDGGNSLFTDTQRREAWAKERGIHFVGCGVSGGEEGARNGPSLMPGGTREAYEHLRPVLEAIAAKTESGPCVTYVGSDGAGHFVKMVHNGIEYGDMQLIAEAYDILRKGAGMTAPQLAVVFDEWNRGPLESFLIEITAKIFRVVDRETGRPLVDLVLDKAGQKGTGKWTAQVALDLAIPIPTIAAAIDARVLSSMKEQRVAAEKILPRTTPAADAPANLVDMVRDALFLSKICSYAQGMRLIGAASEEWKWGIDLREIARIWKGGCIIRARFLDSIMAAYQRNAALTNLLLDPFFVAEVRRTERSLRDALHYAQSRAIPAPAFAASLAYLDSFRSANLPQNLTQAQRDFFGAHTYERTDRPDLGSVHSDWD
jgi:6-phosphogluconate dehydrogenase